MWGRERMRVLQSLNLPRSVWEFETLPCLQQGEFQIHGMDLPLNTGIASLQEADVHFPDAKSQEWVVTVDSNVIRVQQKYTNLLSNDYNQCTVKG